MLFSVLLAVHVVLALLLIGAILIQQGKGATAGAAFGSGASSTVFGARGSASFLTRLTAILAILFFSNSLLLAYLYGEAIRPQSLLDQVQSPAADVSREPATPPANDAPPVPQVIDVPPTVTPSDMPAIPLPQSAAPPAEATPPAEDATPPVQEATPPAEQATPPADQ
jgi:preprotein translocase subunit SecG